MSMDASPSGDRAFVPTGSSPTASPVPASIPSADLDAAIRVMLDCHRGQTDKGGQPYFLHPLRVMMACKGDIERVTAVLHDTVEDSAITVSDIRQLFGNDVANAVQALTRCDGEAYEAFIERCGTNTIARKVKLADLNDNMDLERLGREPSIKDAQRQWKYGTARNRLMNLEYEQALAARGQSND